MQFFFSERLRSPFSLFKEIRGWMRRLPEIAGSMSVWTCILALYWWERPTERTTSSKLESFSNFQLGCCVFHLGPSLGGIWVENYDAPPIGERCKVLGPYNQWDQTFCNLIIRFRGRLPHSLNMGEHNRLLTVKFLNVSFARVSINHKYRHIKEQVPQPYVDDADLRFINKTLWGMGYFGSKSPSLPKR